MATIVDLRRLPAARSLAASLRLRHPRARLLVLVLDDRHHAVEAAHEPFTLVRPEQLQIERFETLAAVGGASALARLATPAVLRWALDRSRGEPVVLLSPHTEVYGSLDRLAQLAQTAGLVLVPRFTTPIPRDGLLPGQREALRSGVIDPGCLVVGGQVRVAELLTAWQAFLETDDSGGDTPDGARWLDLLVKVHPPVALVADPGVALSAWNLHDRRLAAAGRSLLVNGAPLRTLDFTALGPGGYRSELVWPGCDDTYDTFVRAAIERMWRLDRGHRMRQDQPVLESLCRRHEAALNRHGHEQASSVEYGFARLADGTKITPRLRHWIAEADRHGALPASPFTVAGTQELMRWLNAPGELGGRWGVTRFLLDIYRDRADLRMIHPDLDGPGGPGFLAWIREHGPREHRVPEALIPRAV